MNKWLTQFLVKPDISDNTDRFGSTTNMSDLSGCHQGLLDQNFENIPETSTDNTDRFKMETNMSGLSVPSQGAFEEESLLYDYEERLAIAEMDGNQHLIQAYGIAYLDAFIFILSNLTEDDLKKEWLAKKVQAALVTLEVRNNRILN